MVGVIVNLYGEEYVVWCWFENWLFCFDVFVWYERECIFIIIAAALVLARVG